MASIKRIEKAKQVLVNAIEHKVPVCDALRYVTAHYRSLTRADMLAIAEHAGVNAHTASTQFYKTRHGLVVAPRSLKH